MTLSPGRGSGAGGRSGAEVGDASSSSRRPRAHDGSSATLRRSRSQNGCAPARLDEPDRPLAAPGPRRRRRPRAAGPRARRPTRAPRRRRRRVQRTTWLRPDDDRPDRRQVGRDRGHDEVAAARVEDRAAGRERVAGRAGRAGDDQAVGDERREVRVVDRDVEPADAGQRAAGDDDVVEGDESLDGRPSAAGRGSGRGRIRPSMAIRSSIV